jgi:hypothetical protein
VGIGNNRLRVLKCVGPFDKGCCHARLDVPLGVAVEQVDARVVGDEANRGLATAIDNESVSPHRILGRGRQTGETGGIVAVGVPLDNLEDMTMEMERICGFVVS